MSMPRPANAIFWIGVYGWIRSYGYPGTAVMVILIALVSLAMVGRFKMFSLKFKNFDISDNFCREGACLLGIIVEYSQPQGAAYRYHAGCVAQPRCRQI